MICVADWALTVKNIPPSPPDPLLALSLCLVYYQPSAPPRKLAAEVNMVLTVHRNHLAAELVYTFIYITVQVCMQSDRCVRFCSRPLPPTAKKKTKGRKRDKNIFKKTEGKKERKKNGPGMLGSTSRRLSRGHRCPLFPTDNCPPLCNARSPESANAAPTFVSASVCPCGLCQPSCLEQ